MTITEETIYQAIREVCNADNPQVFAEINKTVFDVAKRALELAESGWAGNAGALRLEDMRPGGNILTPTSP